MSEDGIHYRSPLKVKTACGILPELVVTTSTHWPDVTCGACRLEQPETPQPGQVEYTVPERVQAEDRKLAETDRAARREAQLKAVTEVQDKALEQITYWSKVLGDALDLAARIRADGGRPAHARRMWRDEPQLAEQRATAMDRLAPWHP